MLSFLVVCTGNICRSPLAEALLEDRSRKLFGVRISASSAGTWGDPGNPAMPETVRVAGELGLEVDGHEARPLGVDLVERADVVLGMAANHRDRAIDLVPEAATKAFTLKELAALLGRLPAAPSGADRDAVLARVRQAHELRARRGGPSIPDLDVPDPIGLGMERYRAVAWEIEEAVVALLAGLFGARRVAEAAGAAEGG